MFQIKSWVLPVVALSALSFSSCSGKGPSYEDPTDPAPIIYCGVVPCPDPIPTPVPCSSGSTAGVSSGGSCYPLPSPEPISCGSSGSCGSCGSTGSCGSSGGYFPTPAPTGSPGSTGSGGTNPTASSNGSSGIASSLGSGTKDTGLEQAQFQQALMGAKAQGLVNRFSMSFSSAIQIAQLANRIQAISALGNGQLTAADRQAVTQSALNIVGITSDQVNAAVTQAQQGDSTAAEALLDTAAKNLGMSSSASLRDQLLPALGITLGN